MSYCVNCGVELEKGCPECPLCDTPVLNPREKNTEQDKFVYPDKIDIPKSVNKRYWVFVISMVMLIPNLVLIVLDFLVLEDSIVPYITGGFMVAWVWFLFPFLWKKPLPMLLLAIDALALLIYLNAFRIAGNENGWFARIVLPVVIALWAISNLFILWLKKPRSKSLIVVAVLGAINIMTIVIEICISMFLYSKLSIIVSFVMTACCVSLMIFFAVLAKSRRLKAWVSRKFFM